MAAIKELAIEGVRFIRPHDELLLPGAAENVRVFLLGPPRDPVGTMGFPGNGKSSSLSFIVAAREFHAVAAPAGFPVASNPDREIPFSSSYSLPREVALDATKQNLFYDTHYLETTSRMTLIIYCVNIQNHCSI